MSFDDLVNSVADSWYRKFCETSDKFNTESIASDILDDPKLRGDLFNIIERKARKRVNKLIQLEKTSGSEIKGVDLYNPYMDDPINW